MCCVSSLEYCITIIHILHVFNIILLSLCSTAPPKMIGQTVVYTHAVITW